MNEKFSQKARTGIVILERYSCGLNFKKYNIHGLKNVSVLILATISIFCPYKLFASKTRIKKNNRNKKNSIFAQAKRGITFT